MLNVVAAMIRSDGRFLICQRPEGKANALGWEFPGGKVEAGETPEEALVREIREELGFEIAVGRAISTVEHVYPHAAIRLTLYEATVKDGEPKCLEHADMTWILPEEAARYTFCAADAELIRKIFGR